MARTLVVMAALAGCSTSSVSHAPVGSSTERTLPLPAADYTSPTWLKSGWIVFSKYPDATVVDQEVWRIRPDGSGLEHIQLPASRRECDLVYYEYPTAMWDGRVGLQQACELSNATDGAAFQSVEVAYNVGSNQMAELTPRLVNFSAANFTWAPDARQGLVSDSDQICSSIAAVDSSGLHPLTVMLGSGNRKWRLDDQFHLDRSQPCTRDGLADHPAFSPDGQQVAFFASLAAVGSTDQARLDVTWGLWLMGAAGEHPRAVLEGVVEPTVVAWSPDGRWLAFNARRGHYRGVWLYSPATGNHRRVSATDGSRVSWSPDGHQLVTLHDVGTIDNPQRQLVIYDVSGLLGR